MFFVRTRFAISLDTLYVRGSKTQVFRHVQHNHSVEYLKEIFEDKA